MQLLLSNLTKSHSAPLTSAANPPYPLELPADHPFPRTEPRQGKGASPDISGNMDSLQSFLRRAQMPRAGGLRVLIF